MPLYEYRCNACAGTFEYLQTFSARTKRKCEECGGRLEKLISRSGFVLKGSGWYQTDFKGDAKRAKDKDAGQAGSSERDSGKADPKKDGGGSGDGSGGGSGDGDGKSAGGSSAGEKKRADGGKRD